MLAPPRAAADSDTAGPDTADPDTAGRPGPPVGAGGVPPVLVVSGLEKAYSGRPALCDVTFGLTTGVTGLLGPNGAGKSTLLRCLSGVLEWDRGSVTVDAVDASRHPREARRRLGYMPERVAFPPETAVAGYLRFVARVKGIPRRRQAAAVEAALDRAGLGGVAARLIGNLSKGYRQRVGIAQALLGDPAVAVLDEPLAGLDPLNLVEIRDALSEYARDRAVLISTHVLGDVRLLCDRVLVLSGGRLLYDGPTQRMADTAGAPSRLRIRLRADAFPAGPPEALAGGVDGVSVVRRTVTGDEVALTVDIDGEGRLDALLAAGLAAGWRILAVEPTADQLEDAFRRAVVTETGPPAS
jgi:ABC-2 type transport system ATP-binding protein